MTTLAFIRKNLRFLGFGFLLTFICNLGQTFFIGLYNPEIRAEYGLTNGEFGGLYGLATLFSASMLIWVGRLIDHIDLRFYTLGVVGFMAVACGLMWGGQSVVVLACALGLMRLTGQGLMPHISNTSMARYFEGARGRAISISYLGINAGQMLLPPLAAGLMAAVGWRESWGLYALGLGLIALPLTILLLKGHGERHKTWEAEIAVAEPQSGEHSRMRSPVRQALLKDRRFYLILPGYLSLPLFGTAIFFFQAELLIAKDWPDHLFALSFPVFAVTATIGGIFWGFLVDRLGTCFKLLPFYGVPFALACGLLALTGSPFMLPAMMGVMGFSFGALPVLSGALWAEMFGTRSLGSIRAFVASIMVLGTAATPALFGFLYDGGVTIEAAYWGFTLYGLVFSAVTLPLARAETRRPGS